MTPRHTSTPPHVTLKHKEHNVFTRNTKKLRVLCATFANFVFKKKEACDTLPRNLNPFYPSLFPRLSPLVCMALLMALLVASCLTCHAGAKVVFQYDAQQVATTESNIVWKSIGRAGSPNAPHGNGGSPSTPQLVGDASEWQKVGDFVLNVAGATAKPMRFDEASTNTTIRYAMFVVKNGMPIRMRETILCGAEVLRVAGKPVNVVENREVAAIDRGPFCEWVSCKVDGVEGAPLVAGKMCLIEVEFSRDLELSTLGVGSDTGRTAWKRAFGAEGGGWCELIAFDANPGEALVAARHYLRLKFALDLPNGMSNSTATQRALARAAGVSLGNYFGSLLIVR